MNKSGYQSEALHGDLSQAQRDRVMKRFKNHTLQVLVATDVAARGIDVNDLTHVIHYVLPDDHFIILIEVVVQLEQERKGFHYLSLPIGT